MNDTLPEVASTAPGEILTRKVFQAVETHFVPGERSMVAWISTDTVDHELDVVVSSGIDFKTCFLGETPETGNPVVLAYHDMGRWPLGQCRWVKVKQSKNFNGLYALTVFDDDPDSEIVWRKVRSGSLRGISIGFRAPDDLKPSEWGPPTREEIARRPDWANAKRIIRRCLLLEYSVCSLPMNRHALVAAVNKGVHRPAFHNSPEVLSMSDATDYLAADGGEVIIKALPELKDASDKPWDAAAARSRIAKWASSDGSGNKDTINFGKYARAFLWHDKSAPEDLSSYKIPVFDVENGELVLVKAALRAAASVLGGGRGGVDIPEADMAGVKAKLARLEKEAGVGEDKPAEKSHKCNDAHCDGQCKDMDADDMDTMAMKPGDHVTCKGAGCGEVKSVHDSGEHGGMTATKASPVAMVDQHDKACMPTGKVKAFAMADLGPHAGAKSLGKAKPPTGSGRVDTDDDGDDDTMDSADTEQDDDDIEEDDLDDGDNDDEVKGFRRHDHVKIKAPHYKGVGVIQSMHKAGHVPDVDEDIKATKDNPAARVQCYKAYGDGHLPTEHHVGVEVKHLTHLPEELKAPSRKSLAAALPTKPRAATKAAQHAAPPALPALPPLTGKTPEAKLQDAVANLAKTLDPANLQKVTAGMADQAIARRLGKLSS